VPFSLSNFTAFIPEAQNFIDGVQGTVLGSQQWIAACPCRSLPIPACTNVIA